jgi:hypothetical protein
MHRFGWLAVMALSLVAGASGAEIVCRPTTLDGLTCSGPSARPLPRPPYLRDRGLRQVGPHPDPADRGEVFIPARNRTRLGTTVTDRPLPGTCRPDRLGNSVCH